MSTRKEAVALIAALVQQPARCYADDRKFINDVATRLANDKSYQPDVWEIGRLRGIKDWPPKPNGWLSRLLGY